MVITCQHCFSTYEVPDGQGGRWGCPMCKRVNTVQGGRLDPTRPQPRPSSAQEERPVKTMQFYPDADPKDDPITAIQKAIKGKPKALPQSFKVSLKVLEGDQAGSSYALQKPVSLIGRDKKADIRLRDSEISAKHFCIEMYDDVAVLKDQGSTNGTVVNGYLVKQDLLRNGDRIQAGGTIIQFCMEAA